MSATAAPYGARPVGSLASSGSFTGKTRAIKIASGYAANIFAGDFVKIHTDGTIQRDTGTTALTTCGIFMGCQYTNSDGELTHRNYWPTGTVASDAVAFVIDDPFVVFEMQADDSIAQTGIGANAPVVSGSGSTTFGTSDNAIDGGSLATTNTLPLRIIGFVDRPGSDVGDAYTDCVCIFNSTAAHQYLKVLGLGD